MPITASFRPVPLLAAALMLGAPAGTAGARPTPAPRGTTYVALGDSVAFGYTTGQTTPASVGDAGYVRSFADWLGLRGGGPRPRVLNLAVPGETSTSFFLGGKLGEYLNRNYTHPPTQKQFTLLRQALVRERSSRRVVTTVTVQLGANDLTALVTPSFLQETQAEQDAAMDTVLRLLAADQERLLRELHAAVPAAHVYVLGYYNPLAALPADSRAPLFSRYVPRLNQILDAGAQAHQESFVDLDRLFRGHEGEWTYILSLGYPDGIHPNGAGYAAIAQQLEQVQGGGA